MFYMSYQTTQYRGIYQRNDRFFVRVKALGGKLTWVDIHQNLTDRRKALGDANQGPPTAAEAHLMQQAVAALGSLQLRQM